MNVLDTLLSENRNTILWASAGTGKTEALTTAYLGYITGVMTGQPVSPSDVVAITFTNRAAREMRQRVKLALQGLTGAVEGVAQHIRPSVGSILNVAKQKRLTLDARALRHASQALERAPILTLHSYAWRLLQEHGTAWGLGQNAIIWDEVDSGHYLETAISKAIDEVLGMQASAPLLDEFGGLFRGMPRGRLVDLCAEAYRWWRQYGDSVFEHSVLQTQSLEQTCTLLGEDVQKVYHEWLASHEALIHTARGGSKRIAQRVEAALSEITDVRTWEALYDANAKIDALLDKSVLSKEVRARTLRQTLITRWVLLEQPTRLRFLLDVVKLSHNHYVSIKRAMQAVDFDDVQQCTRELFALTPALQVEIQSNISALLVDECQDINPEQARLIEVLASHDQTTRWLVGDPKQSIYGFRGANVQSFLRLVDDLKLLGARQISLQVSYRSEPELIRAINLLSEQALLPTGQLETHDQLETTPKPSKSRATPVHCIEPTDQEPAAIADFIAKLHREQSMPWRSFGVLLPRMTRALAYQRAFKERGIPVSVAGRGISINSRIPEDVAALCAWLTQTHDAIDVVTVLRGPLVGIGDPQLQTLASSIQFKWPALSHASVDRTTDPVLHDFLERLGELQTHVGLLPLTSLVQNLLTSRMYTEIIERCDDGPAQVALMHQVLKRVEQLEAQGETYPAIIKWLREHHAELHALDLSEHNTDAVSLMTIHQAKGLEFECVCVADLGWDPFETRAPWLWYRAADSRQAPELALALRSKGGRWLYGSHTEDVLKAIHEQQWREHVRLFYVAYTRAKRMMVLSSRASPSARSLWTQCVVPAKAALFDENLLSSVPPPQPVQQALSFDEVAAQALPQTLQWGHADRVNVDNVLEVAATALAQTFAETAYKGVKSQTDVSSEAKQMGTEVHRWLEHWSPAEGDHQVLDLAKHKPHIYGRVRPWLEGAYTSSLKNKTFLKEYPFACRLEKNDVVPFSVVIHGQMDALVIDEKHVDILDYKWTHSREPTKAYLFQLALYRRAVERLYPGKTVRTALVFLNGEDSEPVWVDQKLSWADLAVAIENVLTATVTSKADASAAALLQVLQEAGKTRNPEQSRS